MAREPEYDEDEEYEDEEEEELTTEDLIVELRKELMAIKRELRNCEKGSERYSELMKNIGDISDSIKCLEIGENERRQKDDAASDRAYKWIAIFAPMAGSILANSVPKWIEAREKHKDIKRITDYEADGNIVKTAAQKLIKP